MATVRLTVADLDTRAERLLRLGLASAVLLRDGDPETARRALRQLDPTELLDLATLMAACVDIDRTEGQLLSWWTGRPGVVPLHADEWPWDAPPLRVQAVWHG
jgi:hypothetical protein